MKLSTIIIFLSGFSSAKFQWKKQYSKGQAAKSECRVNKEQLLFFGFTFAKYSRMIFKSCENHKVDR